MSVAAGCLRDRLDEFHDCKIGRFIFFKQLSGNAQLTEHLQLLRMLGSKLKEPIPDEPQSPPGVLCVGKISQMAAELAPQCRVELVQQFVLGFEVCKQRSLGNA